LYTLQQTYLGLRDFRDVTVEFALLDIVLLSVVPLETDFGAGAKPTNFSVR